jgi:hypothetical protein
MVEDHRVLVIRGVVLGVDQVRQVVFDQPGDRVFG